MLLITPDGKKETQDFLEKAGVDPEFPVLLDPEFKVLKKLRLYDEAQIFTTSRSEKGSELPKGEALPATFIIDKSGVLKFKYLPQYYSDRPPVDYILEILPVLISK